MMISLIIVIINHRFFVYFLDDHYCDNYLTVAKLLTHCLDKSAKHYKTKWGVGQTRAKISLNQYMCQLSYPVSWAANGNFQLQLQVPINEEAVFALWHKARLLPNMPKRNLLRGPELPDDFMRNMQIEEGSDINNSIAKYTQNEFATLYTGTINEYS